MSYLSYLRLRWRRRSTICRTLAFVITASLCFLLLVRANSAALPTSPQRDASELLQSRRSAPRKDAESAPKPVPVAAPRALDVEEVVLTAAAAATPSRRAHTVKTFHDDPEPYGNDASSDDEYPTYPDVPKHSAKKEQAVVAEERTNTAFDTAFRDLIDLTPSDVSMRSLLAPFKETGEEHLMDLASRIRVFKRAFEAWERLHQITENGIMHYRNVIQGLRTSQNSAQTLRASLQTYDLFRSYFSRLGSRLFPGVAPFSGDLMLLHASTHDGGRGIVMTLGNDQVQYVLTSIQSFRKLGCQLPIEIMYLGEDDLGEELRDRLEALPGVVTRDMSKMIDDTGWQIKGWAAKPWAILMSSFREALFLDADVLFFVDPETLFDDPQYLQSGALFFKDRNLNREKKRSWIRRVLPKPISNHVKHNRLWTGESGHMQDSGVLVIDKWKHFIPLLLTCRLNGPDRDGNEAEGKRGVYEMVYGDKETFWLSWEMAEDIGYAFHSGSTGIIGALQKHKDSDKADKAGESTEDGNEDGNEDANEDEQFDEDKPAAKQSSLRVDDTSQPENFTVCSPQLLHFDGNDKPLWLNGWLSPNKFSHPDEIDLESFKVHIKEPPTKDRRSKLEMWRLEEANSCCLTANAFDETTAAEKEVLAMIVGLAKEVNWDVY